MYNPPRFKSTELNEAVALMRENSFATIISITDGCPVISHLPIFVKTEGESVVLVGHMARANPHWKSFVQKQAADKATATSSVTVIFHGPHTYISPQWYVQNDVPTWNYLTVHTKGRVELIEDYEGIVECLRELTQQTEKHWPTGWEFYIPEDLSGDALSKNIVAFKIKVDEIDFKKKLSQNRSQQDRVGIIRGLESRSDDNSRLVLQEMKRYEEN